MNSLSSRNDDAAPRAKSKAGLRRRIVGRLISGLSNVNRARLQQVKERWGLFNLHREVGANTFVDRSVQVLGWRSVSIGHHSAISEGTWLNVNERTAGHKHIVIGNNCFIGKRNFFSSGWQIHLGDYCMTGSDCKLMSGDHFVESPLVPYLVSGVANEKVVRLGTNVRLGVGVMVVGHVEIGRGSVIGAGSLVHKDVPPFSIAVGNPCKVIKRFDFVSGHWVAASAYSSDMDEMMPSDSEYLSLLVSSHPNIVMPLQACSRDFGDML